MESENTVSALDICDLDVSYPGREVLRSVSLTVAPGEFCALIGPNGAGKTTLLRAILGAIPSRSRHITSMGRHYSPAQSATFRSVMSLHGIFPLRSVKLS